MSVSLTVYVYTKDLGGVSGFYQGGLGLEPETQHGNWLPFAVGGATFALHVAGPDDDPQRVSVSFGVDDVDAVVKRFEAQGAKVLRDVADEAFGRRAFLQDPDGRQFEVVQHELP